MDACEQYAASYFPELDNWADVNAFVERHLPSDLAPLTLIPGAVEGAPDQLKGWLGAVLRPASDLVPQLEALAHAHVIDEPGEFFNRALDELAAIATRTVIRSFVTHLDRLRRTGLLAGRSSSERFKSFVREMSCGALGDEFWRRNELLVALVRRDVTRYLRQLETVLGRLEADTPELLDRGLLFDDRLQVRRLVNSSGDVHGEGERVVILELTDGRRLVYKPTSLAPAVAFAGLVDSLVPIIGHRLVVPISLDRGAYGWQEHVTAATPSLPARDEQMLKDLGATGALLHLLGATDMHSENIVLSEGGRVVIVDHETILTPKMVHLEDDSPSGRSRHVLAGSILRLGLFPTVTEIGFSDRVVDMGGSERIGSGQTVIGDISVRDFGLDTMRLSVQEPTSTLSQAGNHWTPEEFGAVVASFAMVYRRILGQKQRVCAFVSELFANITVRLVVRPTDSYARLSWAALHPLALTSWKLHAGLATRLAFVKDPGVVPLVSREISDLASGVIPRFQVRADSVFINGVVPGICSSSPLVHALERIIDASEESLRSQLDLLRVLFVNKAPATSAAVVMSGRNPHATASIPAFASGALSVGEYLRKTVQRDTRGRFLGWFEPQMKLGDDDLQRAGFQDASFYSGLSGTALFLAALSSSVGDSQIGSVAIEALEVADIERNGLSSIGMHAGHAGIAYAMYHAGELLNERHLQRRALAVVKEAWSRRELNTHVPLEYTYGLSGFTSVALSLFQRSRSDELADIVRSATNELLRRTANNVLNGEGFLGFAHGAAGIIFALEQLQGAAAELGLHEETKSRLSDVTDEQRKLAVQRRRPDRRLPISETQSDVADSWCHGSAGHLLLGSLWDSQEDKERVLDEAYQHGRRKLDLSLCHGAAGLADVTLAVGANETSRSRASRTLANLADFLTRNDLGSLFTSAVIGKGLLAGVSGLGYALVRNSPITSAPPVLWAGEVPLPNSGA